MGVWCLEFSLKRTTLWQIYWGLLQKTATISQVYHNNNQQCLTMVKEIQNKHIIMVPRQFSSLLMTMLPFSLLEGDDSFTITHPFYSFRFCVINHVSAPKLLSLITVTYPMNTRKAHTVPYNELRHHLWDSLAPSVHTLLCNPVGPRQFCALPFWCLALLQCQWRNMSVGHTSSVVDMLGVQVCPATVEGHALYLPVFMILHILQTPSPTGNGF